MNPALTDQAAGGCMEGSFFTGYKNYMAGATGGLNGGPKKTVFSNMRMIDNAHGFSMGLTASAKSGDYVVEHNDNVIYSVSPIPDCPSNNANDADCLKFEKYAVNIASIREEAGKMHTTSPSMMPYTIIKSDASWVGTFVWNRNKFYNFAENTLEGKKNRVFSIDPTASDYIQPLYFFDNEFINVEENAFVYLMDPNPGWAVIAEGCGEFPCTGPANVLMEFKRNVYSGAA